MKKWQRFRMKLSNEINTKHFQPVCNLLIPQKTKTMIIPTAKTKKKKD